MTASRTAVNPWPWSLAYGFDQGQLVEGASRLLVVSGQAATAPDGTPQHDGDVRAQVSLSVDNLEAVLGEAGMTLGNVVRVTVYATDVDAVVGCWEELVGRFGAAGARPTSTLVGVTRLAFPEMMVEIEATAVD
ncbi:Enamine deaminase RidA, house cleaning of reactive enamine intermediates, YjgF/YER057c/UK114 family [Geodermatophilus saharensis]|uniref:Enamine deaminase RidA, house cleaning of reactive enamine intermediates, YjgF/YER057c/UK114 family n=1 Tax=Geodermatophilus saharensis TaxID=1137994 RepID=A0A239CZ05_9ACTN|nr:RidA family protein [Geodermatophilus saharensis]SNS24794.1 Enamine deaminase RidA, house cleaning of reactive enamine intermediates, YjgF/YER057c/UK114 family [Geodermatophilus saharensis]